MPSFAAPSTTNGSNGNTGSGYVNNQYNVILKNLNKFLKFGLIQFKIAKKSTL